MFVNDRFHIYAVHFSHVQLISFDYVEKLNRNKEQNTKLFVCYLTRKNFLTHMKRIHCFCQVKKKQHNAAVYTVFHIMYV